MLADCVSPPTGLVSWWRAEGNTTDSIGMNNGTLASNGAGFAAGKIGQGFRFDGTNGYVQIPDSDALKPANITCEAWVRLDPNLPPNNGGEQIVFKKNTWSAWFEGYSLLKVTIDNGDGTYSNRFQFCVSRYGNQVAINSQTIVQRGQWYHVAGTYDGNQSKLYVNGALEASATPGFALDYDTTPIFIGTSGTWPPYLSMFGGIIDELSIYNRALVASEITAIYNAGSAGKCAPANNFSHVPAISSFTPTTGSNGIVVVISGTNFSSTAAANTVYFGAVKANVLTASADSLSVTVPPGATYAPITVTVNGLTAWANAPFMPTFNGGTNNSTTLAPRLDLPAGNGSGQAIFADVDGDGKPDLLVNSSQNFMSIYRNISTNGALLGAASFAPRVDVPMPGNIQNAVLADVDGDGQLDIVVLDRDAGQVHILKNLSTPGNINSNSFGASVDLSTGNDPRGLVVRDLDGDGLPDIAVANWADATVGVYRNLGTSGGITTNSFAAPLLFAVGANVQDLKSADLDGDGLPDLVTANNNYGTANSVSVLRNLSSPGTIAFAPQLALTGLPTCYWMALGDLDGDGKIDLAVSSFEQGQAVSVYRNLSSPGNLAFAPNVDFSAGGWGNAVAIADLDGDGKPDLAVVTQLPDHLSIFKNLSTPGSFTADSLAARVDYPTGWNPNGIAIGDLDGDGLPDIEFAVGYGATLSIYQNQSSPVAAPSIQTQPASQIVTVGNSANFSVQAAGSPLLTYQWQFNGTNISDATNSSLTFFNVTSNLVGNYSVLVSNAIGYAASSNALLTVIPAVCVTPPAGLISWWRAESNALDTVGGNDGTLQNGASFAPANVGGGFQFDGVDDFVLVTGSPSLDVGAASGITFEGWINPATLSRSMLIVEYERLLASDSGSDVGVQFAINVPPGTGTGPGSIVANIKDNTDADHIFSSTPNLLAAGVWQHVAWVYDKASGMAAFYLNGTIVASTNLGSFTPQTSFANLLLGARTTFNSVANPSDTFAGGLDELSLYDRALSPAEIQSIYNAASAGKCNVPVGPSFVVQPQNISVQLGASAQFGVVAGGTIPLNYQWLVNSAPIANETNATLNLSNIQFTQSGNLYSVLVTNAGGAVTSSNAVLTVLNSPPQISGIPAQHAPLNSIIGPLAFTVSDDQTPADQIVVTVASSNNGIVPTNQIVLGGSGTNRSITILPGTNAQGTAIVTLTAMDNLGTASTTSFFVTLGQFTPIAPGLPPLTYSSMAWGDYDNDGHLDLLVSGTTNGSASGAVTRIYHNNGGVFTNFISLTNLYRSAVAWVDYDRDGRLDALVSGINSSNVPATRLYHNNGNGTFTDINAGFAGAYSGTVAWGDFDNNGTPDLFLSGLVPVATTGTAQITTNIAKLYRNNGDGTFADMNLNLLTPAGAIAGPNNGTAAWGDFDNDGKPDLLLVGSINNTASIASVYRNLGNGNFTNVFSSPVASSYGGAGAWGDYDNDGWLDIAISGALGSTAIYHNNHNGVFTLTTSLPASSTPAVAWGDFNNDGYLDLIVGGNISTLYLNKNGGSFISSGINLPAILNGSLAWGDFDGDGNLDILFAGSSVVIYHNNNGVSNTPPAVPTDLASTLALTNAVVLRWQAPADSQTKSNGLNYNIRVSTTPGGINVVSPLADPTNGLRRVVAMGNCGPTNRAMLINLQKGTYYWSVQAIDSAFAGSPFAFFPYTHADYSFTITNSLPFISSIPDITIAPGTNSPGPAMPFTIGDAETFAGNLTIAVRSSNTNVVALTNIVVTRGIPSGNYPSNCAIRVAARTNGISVITVTVIDAQGAFASASFTVTAAQFTLASTNFVQVQNSLVAWGDYNNDGRLDVLIAGATNGYMGTIYLPTMQPVTQLYRNDGNGVFTPVPTSLPNVTRGAAAWGDFDNDGNLDLILTGTTNNYFTGAISRIYRNNGNGTFTDIGARLPGVYGGAVAWGDFDNDGRLDLLLTGTTNGAASGAIARIYHNNGDGTFSNSVTFPGIYFSSVACADFDGDGDLDLVISGMTTTGQPFATVYRNNGDGTFSSMASLKGASYNGSLSVGDFDNDGLPDILMTGYTGSSYLTLVFHNLGNFNFFEIGAGLPGVRYASAAWGDFDNDGRLDILLSGTSTLGLGLPLSSGAFTRVYRNTGSSVASLLFTNFPVNLPTNYSGTVAWADFDNNGTLDVLITGTDGVLHFLQTARSHTALYRNNNNVTNTPSTAPTILPAAHSNNIVSLTWAKSTDAQTTNSNGLKYEIRVGTAPGGIQIESPLADLNNGFRRVVQTGDASTNKWRLNLPPGTYYWSVQAIDTAFAGSPFAAEASFVLPHPPIAVADAFSTASNAPVTFAAAKLTLNDIDVDGYPLTVNGVSAGTAFNGTAALATGQVTYTPPLNFTGNDSFTYTITDGQGDYATGIVMVTVGSGGAVALNIVFGPIIIGGNFIVSFAGIPGLDYTIEASSSLAGPWTKVANLSAPVTDQGQGIGVFSFSEPVNGNSTRFYRTVYPAY